MIPGSSAHPCESQTTRWLLTAAGLALVVVGIWLVVKVLPEALTTGGLRGKDRAEEIGRTRTGVLAVLAGLIAATGAVYTARSFELNRQGQITERFTRAIDQLGNPGSLDVRLGGIHALER